MKKEKLLLTIILLVVLALLIWLLEQKWLGASRHQEIIPSSSQPSANQATAKPDAEDLSGEMIRIKQPAPDSIVTSPLVVSGEARGRWFFEGSFPLKLESAQGDLLATGVATASGNWMTDDFVPFLGQLDFSLATDTAAFLVLQKDNPAGLPEYEQELRLPLLLKSPEPDKLTVKVFFSNSQLDPQVNCERVFAVERQILRTTGVARAGLEELLKDRSETERATGYQTNINDGVAIKILAIKDQTAYVDFSRQLDEGVAGSCRVSAIRSQISETLRQFPNVKEVVISVEGNAADALQP